MFTKKNIDFYSLVLKDLMNHKKIIVVEEGDEIKNIIEVYFNRANLKEKKVFYEKEIDSLKGFKVKEVGLIILCLSKYDMKSLEFANEVKNLEPFKNTPKILCMNTVNSDQVKLAYLFGVSEILIAPVSEEQLLDRISRAVFI